MTIIGMWWLIEVKRGVEYVLRVNASRSRLLGAWAVVPQRMIQ
jgi:hypothetical protein